jgi:hypothetical protein
LSSGKDFNGTNIYGQTALFKAIKNKNLQLIKQLVLSNQLDINLPTPHFKITPLHLAVDLGTLIKLISFFSFIHYSLFLRI